MPGFSKCPCLRPQDEEVQVLDYRHCSLDFLPSDVFTYERTLEELYVDANQIRDLPRELFYCHGLRKLCLSDNEIISIPPAIASLTNLQHLDISKNGIIDIPENIKQCKSLSVIEASVNPLGKLPEGSTQLLNLTELYLNDTFLDYMPGTFGRLTKLRILEVRENHLKTLPKSFSRLTQLERLDIGNNDFTEIPEVVGTLLSLLELWCDTNRITALPKCLGHLKQLMYLDASKNRLESVPPELEGCVSLADLHLSTNLIRQLPESIGRLSNLTTFKVDDNRLQKLPFSIGGLVSLSELNLSTNELEEVPPSIGLLRHLRTLYADENYLGDVPPELGSCSGLTVLSLRSNNLTYIPDELGRIPRLRVLNLSDNKLRFLPYSLTRLKEIQALWLAENQTKPLVRLQSDVDSETGQRVLTCYLLPQQAKEDREDLYSDTTSFHPSMWEEERLQRQQIKFDFGELEERELGRLERTPTPYPKEMKHRIQHMRNLALKQLTPGGPEVKGRSPEQPRVEGRGSPRKSAHLSTEDLEAGLRLGPPINAQEVGLTLGPPINSQEAGLFSQGGLPISSEEAGLRIGAPLHTERHILLHADKEKTMKDKARIKHHRSSQGEDSEWENKSTKSTESLSKGKDKSRSKSSSKQRLSREEDNFPSDSHKVGSVQSVSMHRSQTFPGNTKANGVPSDHRGSQSRIRGSDRSVAIMSDTQYPEVPQTYTDFRRDLQSRSGVLPTAKDTSHMTRRPYSYHPHNNHRRTKGYESDTGYRSEGVQSEIVYTKRPSHNNNHQKPMYGSVAGGSVRDGYASDWEAMGRHRQSHSKHSRPLGYGSHQQQMGMIGMVPPPQQQQAYSNNYTGQNHSKKGGQQTSLSQPMPPTACVPSTNRTTLRNDELYEPHKNKNRKSKQDVQKDAQGQSSSVTKTGQVSSSSKFENQGAAASVRSEGEQATNGSIRGGDGGATNKQEVRAGQEVNNEDDAWRAQLYQASVKLQKSPSDPNKQLHKRPGSSPTKHLLPSTPSHSTEASISSTTHRSTPPYPQAPPYSPPTSKHTSQPSTESFASQNSPPPTSMASNLDPQSSRYASPGPKATTLPVNTNVYQVNSRSRTDVTQSVESLPFESMQDKQRPHTSEIDIRLGSVESPAAKSTGSASKLGPPRTPASGSSHDSSRGAGLYHVTSPPRVSNYEKDVAVFKGKEPTSQVSSSTDSGYVHGQLGDRISGDLKIGSPYSPHVTGSKHADYSRTPVQYSSPLNTSSPKPPRRMEVTIEKKPGLGFSIAGGLGSPGNPYRPTDVGIFITKVQADGPAAMTLQPGDKILQVNGVNFERIEHSEAVTTLRKTGGTVHMVTERY